MSQGLAREDLTSDFQCQAHPAWPEVLVPVEGAFPPRRPADADERVLHLALRTHMEGQPGLARALRSIASDYVEVDWGQVAAREGTGAIGPRLLDAARALRPTLVFLQIQQPGVLAGAAIQQVRALADPRVVIVNWDGDQHFEPSDPARRWFVEVGAACDTSLVVNTRHPFAYRELGVRRPGYLQIGVDESTYNPSGLPPAADAAAAPILFLGSCYPQNPAYAWRREIVAHLGRTFPRDFAVCGFDWSEPCARPWLPQPQEAGACGAARAVISMSIRNDLPRYSSDRLFRALACGAYVLVERFPDAEGLGLRDGSSCRFWSGRDELEQAVNRVLAGADPQYDAIRAGAAWLGQTFHTWTARMGELLAIVDAVRADATTARG